MTTNISIIHPAITLLRQSVEEKYGQHITQTDAVDLAWNVLKGQLHEDTIRQVWGFRQTNNKTIRRRTLDILSHYVGCSDWEDFVKKVQSNEQSDSELVGWYNGVNIEEMPVGAKISISWQPDRTACLRYEGNRHFTILEVENSSTLQAGDSFDCSLLAVHQPAVLTNLIHDGNNIGAYTIGYGSGLTAYKIEK